MRRRRRFWGVRGRLGRCIWCGKYLGWKKGRRRRRRKVMRMRKMKGTRKMLKRTMDLRRKRKEQGVVKMRTRMAIAKTIWNLAGTRILKAKRKILSDIKPAPRVDHLS